MKVKVAVAAFIFLLVFVGLGLVANPPMLMGAIDTSSEFGLVMGIQGTSGHPVWAAEILEHRYVTSGNLNGDSQEISANVGLVWNPTEDAEIRIIDAYYVWTISSAGDKMPGYGLRSTERTYPMTGSFPRVLSPGQEFLMGVDKWNVKGPVIGTLEFTFFAEYEVCEVTLPGDGLCSWSPPQTYKFASDTALLVSGVGNVRVITPQPVSTGSAIVIGYETGVATDVKGVGGWLLEVLSPSGNEVASWGLGNLATGTVLLTATSDMIKDNSDNRYQVRLYNSLLGESKTAIVVLGNARNAPQAPQVSYTINQALNGEPSLGGFVVLSFLSEPNLVTERPIVMYGIVFSGNVLTEIVQPGTGYTFRLSEKSNLEITITAFDGEETSAPTTIALNFSPPPCGNCLGIPNPLADGLLFYVLFAILIVFSSMLIWLFVPVPWWARVILLVVIVAVNVLTAYWAVVPAV